MEPVRPLPPWMAPAEGALRDYATLLAEVGAQRGLIGPLEVPRLWDRHLLNCAVVADPVIGLVTKGAAVIDIGSGAGLPGLVWAICRPDVQVSLIEARLRRAMFLDEVVGTLGLQERVEVVRARAEEVAGRAGWRPADVVTARAVAPLPTLLGWMLPLLRPGGLGLALKGARAEEEVQAVLADPGMRGVLSGAVLEIAVVGAEVVEPPTTVVVARTDPAHAGRAQ